MLSFICFVDTNITLNAFAVRINTNTVLYRLFHNNLVHVVFLTFISKLVLLEQHFTVSKGMAQIDAM